MKTVEVLYVRQQSLGHGESKRTTRVKDCAPSCSQDMIQRNPGLIIPKVLQHAGKSESKGYRECHCHLRVEGLVLKDEMLGHNE